MRFVILITLIFLVVHSSLFSQKVITANSIGNFNDGVAPFLLDNKWGFFDNAGNIVIQPKLKVFVNNYGDSPRFSEGLTAIVDIETGRVGYIDKKGEIKIPAVYYSATSFNEGVAFVGRQNDYVMIDTTGKIIGQNFVAINGYYSRFSNNRACVQKGFVYGYINKNGKFVIEAKFDEADDFSEGLAAVKMDGKWGFIDTLGNVKIDFKFSNKPNSFMNGRSFIQGTNNKWGIIDTVGNLLIEPIYHQVFNYSGGYAVVSLMDEKWNLTYQIIDVNGKPVKVFGKAANSIETITILSGFSEGYAIAMKGCNKGFIDYKGKPVVGFMYRELHPMSCGMAYFEKFDEKTKKVSRGFINSTGKEVIFIEEPKF